VSKKTSNKKTNYHKSKSKKKDEFAQHIEQTVKKFKEPREKKEPGSNEVRLNKFIANGGIAARRKADELIKEGAVSVNGKVVLEPGFKIKPKDKVTYKGKVVEGEKLYYVLLNKPKGVITTTSDEKDRKTVMDIVDIRKNVRLFPVGRLDRNTTGLLLITNDGDLSQQLAHPSSKITKVYQAELDKPLTEADLNKIKAGLTLEDGLVEVDEVAYTLPRGDDRHVGIELHVGKNRIVRRIYEHLGYEVKKLDRVLYAGLTKKNLPRGKWRFLTEKEVIFLKYFISKKK